MDEQKKAFLKGKFAEAEKIESKNIFERILDDLIQKAKQRRDIKVLN